MKVLEKAKELAQEIMDTDEYAKLTSAEKSLGQDEKGNKMLEELRSANQEYMKAKNDGTDELGLKVLEKKLKEKESGLMDYDVTKNLIESKNAFDELMGKINQQIFQEIRNSEEGCDDSDCTSCKGCN